MDMAKTQRVDQLLVDRGIAADLEEARRLVMAGKVLSGDQLMIGPSQEISQDRDLQIIPAGEFVSRGGAKLQAAFEEFAIKVGGLVCADVGASTGGFTDCLLQHGADQVFAIDVGYGILDWNLRHDPRVVVLERTNARTLGKLPKPVEFISADVSFISLKAILPTLTGWYADQGGEAVLLIKPQFEATKEEAARGAGVIASLEIHQRVITEVLDSAADQGFHTQGVIRSPLRGPAGNQEYLAWLGFKRNEGDPQALEEMIDELF
jgi:23S rRNA (cytidine1920-2'-O)/16S rRNA (cytidine1409-2'-O)-methyltransferase